jgi:uncharacterized lipoprotein YajG
MRSPLTPRFVTCLVGCAVTAALASGCVAPPKKTVIAKNTPHAKVVTIDPSSVAVAAATTRTASSNASWFTADGWVVPLTLRTYWTAAAWTSSSVAGGSKLCRTRMFRHIPLP